MQFDVEITLTAFMEDPDAPRPNNPIHSSESARSYGYKGALIGGVNVYGWGTRAILEAFGTGWLSTGWIDVSFRRPVYNGDVLATRISTAQSYFEMENQHRQVCLKGSVGNGEAQWFQELRAGTFTEGKKSPDHPPQLSLETAPVGKNLLPRDVFIGVKEALEFTIERQADETDIYHGDKPLIHPAWLAGQMTHLLHHSFAYGPAIHTRSHIQHLAPAYAGQTLTVTGFCVQVYERKGHHYIVNDGSIWSEDRQELVRMRHTAIFNVAKRG